MMQRIFIFLFFFMALTFCIVQAIPTDENVKDQSAAAAAAAGDAKALDTPNFLGLDLSPLIEYLVHTLNVSKDGLIDLIEVTIDLLNEILIELNHIV